nr:hypothetical protein [Oceanococcus sp. HetDA_MAG_MS8]
MTQHEVIVVAWDGKEKHLFNITAEQFLDLERSSTRLTFGVVFEQRLDLLIENFAELERCIIDAALRYAIFGGDTYDQLGQARHTANRYLSNLMSSAKMYLDQTSHDLSSIFGHGSEAHLTFVQASRDEYDRSLSYRCLEALRNHAQHRALPVHGMEFSVGVDEVDSDSKFTKHKASMSISVRTLKREGSFKAAVLSELEEFESDDDRIQLMPFVRDYIGGIGVVHRKTREFLEPTFVRDDSQISLLFDLVEDAVGKRDARVDVIFRPKGSPERSRYFSERATKDRLAYAKKNPRPHSLDRHYVSSRPDK